MTTPAQTQLTRATHTIDLATIVVAGSPPPEWVHLIPSGQFSGRDGRGPYMLNAEAVLQGFKDWAKPLPIDYEHQTLWAVDNGQPAPAAAWIHELDSRADGIWGRVTWTERGAAFVQSLEYRYLSPVFDHDRAGNVELLLMAGLTNDPNLYLTAIARRGGHQQEAHTVSDSNGLDKNDWRQRLLYMLDLPATSTDDEIATHLGRIVALFKQGDGVVAQMRQALSLPAEATLDTVAHAMTTGMVPRAEYDRVAHKLKEVEASISQGAADSLIREAMTAGKLPPAQEGWARAYASRDLQGLRDYLANQPAIVTSAHTASAAAGQPPSGGVAHAIDHSAIFAARR